MGTDIDSDSYATISFSNDTGIPVDSHTTSEYYILGPQNNASTSDIFIGVNNYQEKRNALPNTGISLEVDILFLITLYITIVLVLLHTFRQSTYGIDGKEIGREPWLIKNIQHCY